MGKHRNKNRKQYIKRRRKNREIMRKQVIDSESEQQHASTEPHNLQDIEHESKQAKHEKMDEIETKLRQDPLYRGFPKL